jgi:ferritin heavy chain
MWAYFSRDDVALPGLAAWFAACSLEERDHGAAVRQLAAPRAVVLLLRLTRFNPLALPATGLMNYQNLRGGRVTLTGLAVPVSEFGGGGVDDALAALTTALALERQNYTKLLALRDVAEAQGDSHLTGYVDSLLVDQVESVRKCADFVAQVRRCGPGYGTWAWDKALAEAVAAAGGGAAAADAVGAQPLA